MERLDVVPGEGVTTVYSLGTLYGDGRMERRSKAIAMSTASPYVTV